VWRADGIEVTSETRATWDAAVTAFRRTHRPRIAEPMPALAGRGVPAEQVPVLGVREYGLDGSAVVRNGKK